MRIGLVSQEYPPETAHGGIGTQCYLKAHRLAGLGHEVHVISASVDDQRHDYQDEQVAVTRIPGFEPRLPLYTEPAYWLTYSAEVAATISELHERLPFDLLEFPEWAGEGYVHLLNRTEWNYIPTVIQIHGPIVMFAHSVGWPETDSELYRVGTMMESGSLRLADAVYSSSACSADWCARHYGLRRDDIQVLHAGVDTELFQPQPVPKSERPTIIFVGRITGDKGAQHLVQAACELAHRYPDLQVRLLGRGDSEMLEELHATARQAGGGELVDLPGFIDRRELPRHLSAAHIFALPSTHEPGPGLVYLEAMACGLPAVACEGAGAAEVVVPGENGMLVPPGDVPALTAALDSLLADAQKRTTMARQARSYALEHADSRRCVDRIAGLYEQVVQHCRAGGT